ncbi:hypothetical protein ACP70R_003260 [Stipagrostis hirtigluma subsp. patula]
MSAAPQRPRTRTASMCTAAETARGTHSFKIAGSCLHRGLGVLQSLRSATFAVGGHSWYILYYPDGYEHRGEAARVLFDFRLVTPATGLSSSVYSGQMVLNTAHSPAAGTDKFIKKSDLQALGYLVDGCLEIECDVTVIVADDIDVPPSDMLDDIAKLLDTEEGADVTLKVQGEVFRAHRIVLSMRSPVFKAELYGPMSNNREKSITVKDMQPSVFKALLHFIYKDSLPAMDDLEGAKKEEMVRHLLVAADRYAMERMKLMCENILCKRIDVESVATTLALADQHHCNKLKDACIRFINSSNRMGDVAASQGYKHLKRACPDLASEIWEKSSKPRKI